ncbi:MAG: DNA adenine methylase [Candidatus Brocadia sp.]|uniref:site-specific DNA-methyltransferase (adenine-specific) n=1 Tax=Candidatus Brocadia fulgida TaxID=380242 RepID=A0A0M2UUU6_9BACT|nr:MAG: putative DNA methyltransferase [Candidatus Brocadia fulgida]UJS21343.1 MAG: DNA adenine methylase [Candidatus Brocadia sp.]
MLLRSVTSRIGSKGYLTCWLLQHVPHHVCYLEPFAGGAKLFFAKERSQIEILNDKDERLVNLYRVIQNNEKRQRLIKLLNETPYSRSVFNHFRKTETQDDVEKAGRYFFLSKASFAGDVLRGGFAVPSITGRNPVISFRNATGGLDDIAKRLRNVCIENLPYAECIKRYDSPGTLVYADPPYWNAEHYYGKDSFSQEDHYRLAELLHGVKGKIMVSHYANELYDNLYAGWNRYEYQSFKGSHKSTGESKPKTVEVLYCNFEPVVRSRNLFNGYA